MRRLMWIAGLGLWLAGCGRATSEPLKPTAEGESHWLAGCGVDADCPGALACVCGVCSTPCADLAGCGALGAESACVAPTWPGCGEPEPLCAAVCVADADCAGYAGAPTCRAGICAPRVRVVAPEAGPPAPADAAPQDAHLVDAQPVDAGPPDAAAPDAEVERDPACRRDRDCERGDRCLLPAGVCAYADGWGGDGLRPLEGVEGVPLILDCEAHFEAPMVAGCSWTAPDASPATVTGRQVEVRFDDQGRFTVGLALTGPSGEVSTLDIPVTVTDRALAPRVRVPAAVEGAETTVAVGFDSHPSDPVRVLAWAPEPLRVSDDGRFATYRFDDPEIMGSVCVRVADEDGQRNQCVAVPVADVQPRPALGGPFAVAVGEALELDGRASEPGASSDAITGYRWDLGDGRQAEGASVTHAWAAPGVYRVQLEVADEDSAAVRDAVVAVGDLGGLGPCGARWALPDLDDPLAVQAAAAARLSDAEQVLLAIAALPELPGGLVPDAFGLASALQQHQRCVAAGCDDTGALLMRLYGFQEALRAAEGWPGHVRCLEGIGHTVSQVLVRQAQTACGPAAAVRPDGAGGGDSWHTPPALCALADLTNGCLAGAGGQPVAWPDACHPVGCPCEPDAADDDCPTGRCAPLCLRDGCEPVCWPATCTDGLHNGAETGLDCGGPCTPCAPGEGCATDRDCAEGLRCDADARCR